MAFPENHCPVVSQAEKFTTSQRLAPFENIGLETVWRLELFPDNYCSLVDVEDVRLHFRYATSFADSIATVIRCVPRKETVILSVNNLLIKQMDAFQDPNACKITLNRSLFSNSMLDKHIDDLGVIVVNRREVPLNYGGFGGVDSKQSKKKVFYTPRPDKTKITISTSTSPDQAPGELETDESGCITPANHRDQQSGVAKICSRANWCSTWEISSPVAGKSDVDILLVFRVSHTALLRQQL